jgi:hypothetical protein
MLSVESCCYGRASLLRCLDAALRCSIAASVRGRVAVSVRGRVRVGASLRGRVASVRVGVASVRGRRARRCVGASRRYRYVGAFCRCVGASHRCISGSVASLHQWVSRVPGGRVAASVGASHRCVGASSRRCVGGCVSLHQWVNRIAASVGRSRRCVGLSHRCVVASRRCLGSLRCVAALRGRVGTSLRGCVASLPRWRHSPTRLQPCFSGFGCWQRLRRYSPRRVELVRARSPLECARVRAHARARCALHWRMQQHQTQHTLA